MPRQTEAGAYRSAIARLGIAWTSAITAVGTVGAAAVLALAISGVTRASGSAPHARYLPSDSLAVADEAEKLLLTRPKDPPDEVSVLALASLRQQALNPKALRILGYVATALSDEPRARALIQLAESQSRRDVLSQLWLIEDAVARGDVNNALAHYDIALRTKPSTYTMLFPILVDAIGDPDIRAALGKYVRTDENWAPQFLTHAISNSSDLPALVELLTESGGLKDREANGAALVGLLSRLINDRRYQDARRLYLQMPGASLAGLSSAAFNASDATARFGPIGWTLRADADAGGAFGLGENRRPSLAVFASPATTATVASKLLFVRPGRYELTSTISRLDGDGDAQLRWQLRCAALNGDRPVWSQRSGGGSQRFSVQVPQGCPVQYLDIAVSGGSGSSGLDATIDDIALAPVR